MSVTTAYRGSAVESPGRSRLRQLLAGAAVFDAGMGVFTLAMAASIGRWLAISGAAARVTGAVFIVAAVAGAAATRNPRDVRGIVAANLLFAACCLGVLAGDSPNALGIVLLAGGAVCSAGTAVAERRLSR